MRMGRIMVEKSLEKHIEIAKNFLNPKSDYYNDICSSTTSECGTDISLKDRKNEFINNIMSLCE